MVSISPPVTPSASRSHPLWLRAVIALDERIASGALPAGTRLPPERELCEELGVSRVTLRKALQRLGQDGVLSSAQGRGWYVAGAERNEWPNTLESFSETADRMGLIATSRVLLADTADASLDEAEELSIAPGTLVFHLRRVRMLNTVPIAVDEATIPAAAIPNALSIDFRTASLYQTMVRAGLELLNAEATIEARGAEAGVAGELGIRLGDPVLVMRQLVRSRSERPVLSSAIHYAGDRYRLRTRFVRGAGGFE